MKKYLFILSLSLFLPLSLFAAKTIDMHSSPTCGCCKLWADYMQKKGYEVKVTESRDYYKIKDKYKIKPEYQSCHTGILEGYVVEGHVPESAIEWLLKNKPENVIGISVPGMPLGSPGMEQGNKKDEYPVLLLYKDGSSKIYGHFKGETLTKKGL